jgi:anti-anti-sigma regulatory factor
MARSVIVTQIPETLTPDQVRLFVRELEQATDADRPSLVLDCSTLDRFETERIRLLLLCLEEAMKRNGDVRLARIPPETMAFLEETGIARLFRIYKSSAEAVNSFHRPFTGAAMIEQEERLSA